MKLRSIFTILSTLILATSLSAAPKQKTLKIGTCVIYSGYVEKKVPAGAGMMVVVDPSNSSQKDVIKGTFNGNVINHARFVFGYDGPFFCGQMSYEIKDDKIIFTLLDGILEGTYIRNNGIRGGYDEVPFSISIENPVIISKTYHDFAISPVRISTRVTTSARKAQQSNPDAPISSLTMLQSACHLAQLLERYGGITQTYNLTLTLKDKNVVIGADDSEMCKRYDLHNGAYVEEIGKQTYTLKNSKNYFQLSPKGVVVRKVFDDGIIEYDSNKGFDESKGYADAFLNGLSGYLLAENRSVLEGLRCFPEPKVSGPPTRFLSITCSDGRSFYGELFPGKLTAYGPTATTKYILSLESVATLLRPEYCYDGVLNYSDGRQEVYVKGYTLDEVIKYNQENGNARQENLRRAALEMELPFVLTGNIQKMNVAGVGLAFCADFDEEGQLLKYSSSDGPYSLEIEYKYNDKGYVDYSITTEIDEVDDIRVTYNTKYHYDDKYNLIRAEKYQHSKLVSYEMYAYDASGNRIKYELFVGRSREQYADYSYDSNGRLVKEVRNGSEVMTYSYDSAGRLLRKINNLSPTFKYVHEYKYDSIGNVVEETVYENSSREPYSQDTYEYTYR